LVADRFEEASRPLQDDVASLKLLLERFGESLELTEACKLEYLVKIDACENVEMDIQRL
jgi:hypothetical protein